MLSNALAVPKNMRVHLHTLGCRLNQAEEARFAADFLAAGFETVSDAAQADVCVLHSCAVTRRAERESLRLVRAMRQARPDGRPLIVLSGCVVACNEPGRLLDAGADLLIAKVQAGTLVAQVLARLQRPVPPSSAFPPPPRFHTKRALLRVQDGCEFNCAYCIVPLTRGAPVSRPWTEVLDEARALLDKGHRELVVTGCNLACYRDGSRGLPDLTDALCRLAPEGRIRLGSVEPGTVERDLADVMRRNRNLCRFLHLPVQTGDGALLRRMGRRYDADGLRATLAALLQGVPGLARGPDLITGLPGEDENDFLDGVDWAVSLGMQGLKLHNVYVPQGTELARQWRAGGYRPLARDEYVDMLCAALPRIPSTVVMQRIQADPAPGELLAPAWALEKRGIITDLRRALAARGLWQGCRADAAEARPEWYGG